MNLSSIMARMSLVVCCLFIGVGVLAQKTPSRNTDGGRPFTGEMPGVNPGAKLDHNHTTLMQLEAHPIRTSDFARRGKVQIDGSVIDLYLAANTSYTRINASGERWADTSTLLMVDQNHDGWISLDECRNISLPVRIGDRMFTVPYIAIDGSQITLTPSRQPLAGLVVGRKCPPFAYKTLSGQSVNLESFKGRTVLIDLWSFT